MKPNENGFTLVEVMVATFIMGVLSVMGLVMLDNALSSKKSLENVLGEIQQLEQARAILKSDLAQVSTRIPRDEFGFQGNGSFWGGDDLNNIELMGFVRNGNEMPGVVNSASTLQFVQYIYEHGDFIRRSRARVDAVSDTPEIDRVLLKDIASAKIEFYDGQIWQDTWKNTNVEIRSIQAPAAIALILHSKRYGPVRLIFATPAGH